MRTYLQSGTLGDPESTEGRARHSVRAVVGFEKAGAHGVTRPTFAVFDCHRFENYE